MNHTALEYASVAALCAVIAAEEEPETHEMVPTQVDPFPEEECPFPRYEPLP